MGGYVKNKIMNNIKVYVIEAKYMPLSKLDYIDSWNLTSSHPKAIEFVNRCKERGSIYPLEEFQYAFNIDMSIDPKTDFIFITDRY